MTDSSASTPPCPPSAASPLRRHHSNSSHEGPSSNNNNNNSDHSDMDLIQTHSFPKARAVSFNSKARVRSMSKLPLPRWSAISEDRPALFDARDDDEHEEDETPLAARDEHSSAAARNDDDLQDGEHEDEEASPAAARNDDDDEERDNAAASEPVREQDQQDNDERSHRSYRRNNRSNNHVLITDQLSIDILRSPTAMSVMTANSMHSEAAPIKASTSSSKYNLNSPSNVTEATQKAGNRDPNAPKRKPVVLPSIAPAVPPSSSRRRRTRSRGSRRKTTRFEKDTRKQKAYHADMTIDESYAAINGGIKSKASSQRYPEEGLFGAFTKIMTHFDNKMNIHSKGVGKGAGGGQNKKKPSMRNNNAKEHQSGNKDMVLKHKLGGKGKDGIAPHVFL